MTLRSELVQVAAVCLAAAQCDQIGHTSLAADNEGIKGRYKLMGLLEEVQAERKRQEDKWGVRHSEVHDMERWLTVLLEEVGEVAEEVASKTGTFDGLVAQAIELGQSARAALKKEGA